MSNILSLSVALLLSVAPLFSLANTDDLPTTGDLVLTDQQGAPLQALHVSAKLDMKVSGMLIYSTLTQRFFNPSEHFVNGKYQFPLPDGASVDGLEVRIGSRVIKAEIKERQQAKKQFDAAVKKGKRAALMNQSRPNLFNMAIANIAPKESIEVKFTFVDQVDYDAGVFRLSVPMTYTPRFNPEHYLDPVIDQVFKLKSPAQEVENPIELNLILDAGVEISNLISNSHDISVSGEASKTIRFKQRFVSMDSDFNLSWRQNNQQLQSTLFTESLNEDRFGMLMLSPQAPEFAQKPLIKETIFIIDTSGSMGGESIRQAKRALIAAVDMLNTSDSFNIIEFNSTHRALFETSRHASAESIRKAKVFINRLSAGGGTQMLQPVKQALSSPLLEESPIRQVLIITDGAIGNEAELTQAVHQFRGDSRLFAIAIGSAPNKYLFSELSKAGRGTFTQINNLTEVDQTMQSLFDKISRPAMKNLKLIDNNGSVLSIEPSVLPDLYYGEPLVVTMTLNDEPADLILSGEISGQFFEQPIKAVDQPAKGIAKLWAQDKIESLSNKMHLQKNNREQLKQEIIRLSIKHHILSRFTSLIAVDHQVARKANEELKQAAVESLAPKGMVIPQTNMGTYFLIIMSLICLGFGFAVRYHAEIRSA